MTSTIVKVVLNSIGQSLPLDHSFPMIKDNDQHKDRNKDRNKDRKRWRIQWLKLGCTQVVNLSHLTIPFQRPLLHKLNLMHEEILCSTFFSGKMVMMPRFFWTRSSFLFLKWKVMMLPGKIFSKALSWWPELAAWSRNVRRRSLKVVCRFNRLDLGLTH